MTVRRLWDHQREALDAVRAEWAAGVTRTAVVHATGMGKGDVLARLAAEEVQDGGRVMILTHREEIMGQLAARCLLHGLTVRQVGQVQGGRNEIRRPVVVGMVPTLAARLRAVRAARKAVDETGTSAAQRELVGRLARLPGRPTLIIADECHYVAAPTWIEVLTHFGAFDHVRTLGATATLIRGDRRRLGDVWESVAHDLDIEWGIENGPDGPVRDGEIGFLVRPRGRAVVADHVDLVNAKISKGDYQDDDLGEMVEQDVAQIVTAWSEHAVGRPTVAFCPTVASARALRDEFERTARRAGLVLGTTPTDERRRWYARLAGGEIDVLVNVMVATVGWDCPPVSCILQCRPTRLPGLYQQMVGRGLRRHPESGKRDCLVLDVVGVTRQQRLCTLIDLTKSVDYDDSELQRSPKVCGECGLETGPADDRSPGCQCPPERREPGDGPTGRRRLIGPARYEDVDLFAKSELSWLFTKGGVRFLPAGDRMVFLWPLEEEGRYAVWHCGTKGSGHDGECISRNEDLSYGCRLAESWAMTYAPTVVRRGADWRKRGGRPSEAQIRFARNLGVGKPETMNKPRLSDEISTALAGRLLD